MENKPILCKPGKNKEHHETHLSLAISYLFVYLMYANLIGLIADWFYWSADARHTFIKAYVFLFLSHRPEICDSQCQGRELCNHILQWWLLRDDGLLKTGHHAEAMYLWLPPRWPDWQRGHQPGIPGCAWVRGVQGGDHLLPEGWWVSVTAWKRDCHSMAESWRASHFVLCCSWEKHRLQLLTMSTTTCCNLSVCY